MFNYNKLRNLRKKAGLLQSELADKLSVSPSTIGMYWSPRMIFQTTRNGCFSYV